MCDNLHLREVINVLKKTVIGHVLRTANSGPFFLAALHTNILCIVYTKEEAKKVLQENKTKRQATGACCGTRARVHAGRVGHAHEGVGACVFVIA